MPTEPGRVDKARTALGAELGRLRARAGLSIRQLGRFGVPAGAKQPIPHARIDRIEGGASTPTADHVRHWLDATQASAAERERVWALLEEIASESSQWASVFIGTSDRDLQRLAAEREQAATGVDDASHQWLAGLVQTRDYADALFRVLADRGYPVDPEADTAARIRRQRLLLEDGRRFRFLLTPRSLAWNPDPTTVSMAEQRQRLLEVDALAGAHVRVLPDDARPEAPWASFTIYDGDFPFVSFELERRSMLALDPEDVEHYQRRFEDMWNAASALRGY